MFISAVTFYHVGLCWSLKWPLVELQVFGFLVFSSGGLSVMINSCFTLVITHLVCLSWVCVLVLILCSILISFACVCFLISVSVHLALPFALHQFELFEECFISTCQGSSGLSVVFLLDYFLMNPAVVL